jgi:hypothetical protein
LNDLVRTTAQRVLTFAHGNLLSAPAPLR